MSQAANASPVAIVCGGGQFPAAVIGSLERQGRGVFLILLRDFADPALARYPHVWIKLGSAGALINGAKRAGCKEIVVIGSVVRPRLSQLHIDIKTLLLLPRLARMFLGGDNKLLSGVGQILRDEGFVLRGAHEVAPDVLAAEGVLGGLEPSSAELADIEIGFAMLRALSPFDVGQAAVVVGRRVIAVEAAEGTSEMLLRIKAMRASGRLPADARSGVLVKAAKAGQELRIDMPAVGAHTVEEAHAAGLAGVAIAAGTTMIADAAAMAAAADDAGLFVIAVAKDRAHGA